MDKAKRKRIISFINSSIWLEDLRPLFVGKRDMCLNMAMRSDDVHKRFGMIEAYNAINNLLISIESPPSPGERQLEE